MKWGFETTRSLLVRSRFHIASIASNYSHFSSLCSACAIKDWKEDGLLTYNIQHTRVVGYRVTRMWDGPCVDHPCAAKAKSEKRTLRPYFRRSFSLILIYSTFFLDPSTLFQVLTDHDTIRVAAQPIIWTRITQKLNHEIGKSRRSNLLHEWSKSQLPTLLMVLVVETWQQVLYYPQPTLNPTLLLLPPILMGNL